MFPDLVTYDFDIRLIRNIWCESSNFGSDRLRNGG